MWHKQLQSSWRNTKSFVHQGYNRLSGWAGEVERAAGIGRNIFSALRPILEEFGQQGAIDQGMKAIKGYDTLRGNVVEADSTARRLGRGLAEAEIFR